MTVFVGKNIKKKANPKALKMKTRFPKTIFSGYKGKGWAGEESLILKSICRSTAEITEFS